VKRARALAALGGAALSVLSCVTFRQPEVRFAGVSVGSLSKEGAGLDVELSVTNPNGYKLGVRELTYRLSIGDAPAGEGSAAQTISIPAHATAKVGLPLKVTFEPLKSSALEMALTGRIAYAIEGEVVFTTPLGSARRPYRHAGNLSLYR
jgi:LEA14-like dessication related protein